MFWYFSWSHLHDIFYSLSCFTWIPELSSWTTDLMPLFLMLRHLLSSFPSWPRSGLTYQWCLIMPSLNSSPLLSSLRSLIFCLLPRVYFLPSSSKIKFLLWSWVNGSFFPIKVFIHLYCGCFYCSLSALPWVSFHFTLQPGNPGLLLPQTRVAIALYNLILQFLFKRTTNIKMNDGNVCHWWHGVGYIGEIMMQQTKLENGNKHDKFNISHREKWSRAFHGVPYCQLCSSAKSCWLPASESQTVTVHLFIHL